jgi:hypothetical protein
MRESKNRKRRMIRQWNMNNISKEEGGLIRLRRRRATTFSGMITVKDATFIIRNKGTVEFGELGGG